jgi:hypothetical protein
MKKQVNLRLEEETIKIAKRLSLKKNCNFTNLIVHLIHKAEKEDQENEIERMSKNPKLIKLVKEAENRRLKGENKSMSMNELQEYLELSDNEI